MKHSDQLIIYIQEVTIKLILPIKNIKIYLINIICNYIPKLKNKTYSSSKALFNFISNKPQTLMKLKSTIYLLPRIFILGFLLPMVLMSMPLAATAQTQNSIHVTIKGTVTDEEGHPIPGVTISVLDTGIGTATDISGNYSIDVPQGAILVFS